MNAIEEKRARVSQDIPYSTYLVGGAVRDKVMGREPEDHDFVVVGLSPADMDERGFRRVEAGFPVFLDDEGDEFALARTEQKVGEGYKGFKTFTGRDITLEDDLKRRDFTMNAMAMDENGNIYDPFDGREDIEKGIVRHVSEAFSEDPLRVMRLARFTARFNFEPAEETVKLAKKVAPELTEIPVERVFAELEKSMKQADNPKKFFEVLEGTDGLKIIFPELSDMTEVPAGPQEFHGTNSVFEHTMITVDEMFKLRGNDDVALLCAFFHDIGKTETPEEKLPKHHKHTKRGVELFEDIAERHTFTNRHERAIKTAIRQHMRVAKFLEMNANSQVKFVEQMDKKDMLELVRDLLIADTRATKGKLIDMDTFDERVEEVRSVIKEIDGEVVLNNHSHLEGKEIHDQLIQLRTERLREISD